MRGFFVPAKTGFAEPSSKRGNPVEGVGVDGRNEIVADAALKPERTAERASKSVIYVQ